MTELSALLGESKRPHVVDDLTQVADTAVAGQSGLTGMALKGALSAAQKVDANIVHTGINRILPDLLGEMQPFWNDFQTAGGPGFGAYLSSREDEVVDSLLKVADRNAEKAPGALTKVYGSLRGKAQKIVGPALPGVGSAIEKHMQ